MAFLIFARRDGHTLCFFVSSRRRHTRWTGDGSSDVCSSDLRKPQLPGRARVLDRRPGRGARAAVVPGDGDVVGFGLGHARRHGADAGFGDELHRDRSGGIGVLQIVDQLGQILDRVDVVVWRRRDQLYARSRIADLGDVIGDLSTGQLAAFAGLCALGHLDLDLLRAREVFGGHAEPAGGNLFDLRLQYIAFLELDVLCNPVRAQPRAQRFARLDGREAPAVLAAFAGVRFAAHAGHRHGKRGVRFDRNRAVRHRAGRETLDDLGGGLDFFDRNGFYVAEAKLEQPAVGHVSLRLVVDDGGVFPVGLRGVLPRRLLQFRDRVRRPHVLLAAHAPGVLAARFQHRFQHRVVLVERSLVDADRLFGNLENIYAPDR